MKRFYQFFRRPKVTIFIIAVLLALFLVGLIIPQKVLFTSRAQFDQWNADHPALAGVINALRLNEVYVAPITVFFLALFFLNLLAVIIHRIPYTLRRAFIIDKRSAMSGLEKLKGDPSALSVVIGKQSPGMREEVAAKAASFFRKRFWSVMTSDDACSIVAVRNRFSPLGFLLFHISFLFCLAGGLLVSYTRFSGNLLLTEGEEFHSDIKQFRLIKNDPKILHALPELKIKLLNVLPVYEGTTGTDLNVSMKIQYRDQILDAVAKVNEPVRIGSISILPESIGISPLFVLKKRGGEVQDGYFTLNVLKGDEDSFQFPGLPYTIFVKFYPDYAEEDGKPATKSFAIKNPVFRFRIQEQARVLYDALRKPGESASFDGLALSCGEIRYWADLYIVREYGTIPLYAGFIIGGVGLIMRLIFFQKTIRVHIEESDKAYVLFIGGSGEYYQHAFREELERLTVDLAGALKGDRQGGKAV